MARTGKWWAHEHFKGVVPDIMLFAKGIASGFPFAGIAAKPEMYQGLPTGSLVSTNTCKAHTDQNVCMKWDVSGPRSYRAEDQPHGRWYDNNMVKLLISCAGVIL